MKQHVLRVSRFTMPFSRKKDIAKKEKVKLLFCAPGIKHVFGCTLCPQLWHWKAANRIFSLVVLFLFIPFVLFFVVHTSFPSAPPTALLPQVHHSSVTLKKRVGLPGISTEHNINIIMIQ